MATPNMSPQGWVARSLIKARAIIDGNLSDPTGPRIGRYGDQIMIAPMVGEPILCDEGALFSSTMLQGATTLQLGLSASFSATAAAFVFKNNAPFGPSSPRCHLRELHMIVTTAPTSATALNYATMIDNVNRGPTVSALGTPTTATAYQAQAFCTNIDENPTASGAWFLPQSTSAGAPPAIPAAGANVRQLIGNGVLRTQIPVVNDDYRFIFGATDRHIVSQLGTNAKSATTAASIVESHPAVSIGPQEYFLLFMWGPSNITAGIAFSQVDGSWFER